MHTKPLNTSLTITDEDNRVIQINLDKRNKITLNAIDAKGSIVVNKVYLTRENLERALNLLDKKAERKVEEAIVRNND